MLYIKKFFNYKIYHLLIVKNIDKKILLQSPINRFNNNRFIPFVLNFSNN